MKLASHRTLVLVLVLMGALALAPSAGARRTASRAQGSGALFNREDYSYTSQLPPQVEARRYRVIVLQSTDSHWVPVLHRLNRHLKILMYQHMMYARADDPHALELCTPLQVDLGHPDWFLKGVSGRPIIAGAIYMMNPGNPSYQRACVNHSVGLAKRLHFDGIFLDGTGAKIVYQVPVSAGAFAPAYPSDAAWQAAVYSFLLYARTAAHAGGLMLTANVGGSTATPGLWQRWTSLLDGAEEESWTDGSYGLVQQLPWWREKLANAAWSEAHGKVLILHSYNTTEAGNTYGLASMMLIAMGHTSYSTSNANDVGYEMWYPEYFTAQRLGAPRGRFSQRPNGVYQRRFANGIVLVNPTAHSVGAFSLGGGRYSGSGLTNGGAVSMGPTSGLILTRVG